MAVARCESHEEIKEAIQDHEVRIRTLEVDAVRLGERLDSLCDRLSEQAEELRGLTNWIKGLIMAMLANLLGFFFWYIQNLR